MKPMTKATPLTVICLLVGGAVLFGLNGFLPVPVETWVAIAGMVVFTSGLIFGLFAFFRGITSLASATSRRDKRLPIVTVLLVSTAWFVVVSMAIQVKRSMDQRAQVEQEHGNELHGTNKE
jgi:membrane-bound ClpP family serine protease